MLKAVYGVGIGYGVWSLVSLVFAINIATALYEVARYFLAIVLLFLVMIAVKQEHTRPLKLCQAVTLVSIVQSLIGVLQSYEIAFADIPGSEMPYGLMVHRTLFGSAQALLLPFAIFVLYRAPKAWKAVGIVAITGIITSVLISQSRSAWLAAAAAIVSTFILIIIFSPQNRKKWIMAIVTGLFLITFVIALVLTTDKDGTISKSIKERASRLIHITSDINSVSTGRLKLWAKSLQLFKQHPVVGVGPGNWHLAIPVYTDENSAWAYGQQVPSWPHNVYLQVACETGVPGAVLFFCMLVLLTIVALKTIANSTSEEFRVLNILMLAGLAAFATDSLFSFPTERIEHSIYLVLMAGIILGSYAGITGAINQKAKPIKRSVLVSILFIILLNLLTGYKKYNFEKHVNLAKHYREEKRYSDVINEVEKGKSGFVTLDPNGEPLEMQSTAAYVELEEYNKALFEIQRAVRFHPNSGRVWTTMGVVYAEMQQYDSAIKCYRRALQSIPHYDVALKNLAGVYFETGDYAACIETAEYVSINNKAGVKELLEEAQKRLREKQQYQRH
ncbi:MAG TPA: O-antigen ligase family protein [Flavisolibacter sp.]|nr:O-antigen ligase family protein [Flavisolibacter sp.]